MSTRLGVFLAAALLIGGPVVGQERSERRVAPVDRASSDGENAILGMTIEHLDNGGDKMMVELEDSWIVIQLDPIWEHGQRTTDGEVAVGLEPIMVVQFDKTTGEITLLDKSRLLGTQDKGVSVARMDRASADRENDILSMTTKHLYGGGDRITTELEDSWIVFQLDPIWEHGQQTTADEVPVGLEPVMVVQIDKTTGEITLLDQPQRSGAEDDLAGILDVTGVGSISCTANSCGGQCCTWRQSATRVCFFCVCCVNNKCTEAGGGCFDLQ